MISIPTNTPSLRQSPSDSTYYFLPSSLNRLRPSPFHLPLSSLYSIWLFTYSDIKTIIAPSFAFGIFTACLCQSFGINSVPTASELLRRAPLMILWSWINLLPFNIDNQRRPRAISEDACNKPWRPLPSKYITPQQAYTIMLFFYPAAFLISLVIGGVRQCLALVLLGVWYNDLKGADASCVIRNFINACGFICHISAPLEVALGGRDIAFNRDMVNWLGVIGAIVFTTVQAQDMYDQAGDRVMGRNTVPLVIGDGAARWTIAIPMIFWSIFCPWYWACSWIISSGFAVIGCSVAGRSLMLRSVAQDKTTFRIWNFWMVCLYALPLFRAIR